MITMILYNMTADRKRINKPEDGALTSKNGVECRLKENTSILNPVILVSKSVLDKNYAKANYAYIKEFGRYYFINNIVAVTGGLLEISMEVDVLKTYAYDLMRTKFEIARAENVPAADLNNANFFIDTERALQNRKTVYYKILGHIPQDSTGNRYTITVAGGT